MESTALDQFHTYCNQHSQAWYLYVVTTRYIHTYICDRPSEKGSKVTNAETKYSYDFSFISFLSSIIPWLPVVQLLTHRLL